MKSASDVKQEASAFRRLLPYVVPLVLLFLAAYVWRIWSDGNVEREHRRYEEITHFILHGIEDALHDYMMVSQGAGGLFTASERVTRDELRVYFEYRKMPIYFPGIQGFAFAKVVQPSELAGHTQQVREEGFPDYTVRPEDGRKAYAPIIFVEPLDERNRRTLGWDMFSEPAQRAAAEHARDTGEAMISGRLMMAPENEKDGQPGFLMFIPTYTNGMPLNTIEERRASHQGYIVDLFRMSDFIQGVFPEVEGRINFEIYDETEISGPALMYAGSLTNERRRPVFSSRKTIALYGRKWTLVFESTPAFEAAIDRLTPKGILGAGIVISLLACFLIRQEETMRKRAFRLAQDITAELRESERKYRILTDAMPVGVAMIGPNMEIITVNPRLREWFAGADYERHPVCYSVFHNPPRMEPCQDCPAVRALQDGQVHTLEREVETSQGMRFLFSHAVPITNESKTSAVLITIQDITERKQAEQDGIAREAAEEANRAKSAFVANMSHEIRTPLNAILGFAQVLERDPSLTPQQAGHVRTINRSGVHLLKLINDILDMSKIEAGRITLNEAPFCLHDFLDDLEMMFRSRANAKGLQLLVEREEDLPRHVIADEGKLRQVLVNLLGNAVKFAKTGGVAVRVRTRTVAEKLAKGKEAVRLDVEVEDTGPGISDEDMDRIFDAFRQTDAGVQAGGTGLGLTISRRFVEMMGGRIDVASQVGKGSCFRFRVPVEPVEGMAEQERPESRRVVGLESDAGPFRILVVDDMPDNRSVICELLRPVGFEVRETGNGAEALEVFEQWSPHAVLMDMRMPIMDGYEATRRIKAVEAGRATPVIAVTASAFEDQEAKILAAGAAAYLRKPCRPEELFQVLGKYLGARYVFADETDKSPGGPKPLTERPETLDVLPKELVGAMRRAVEEGDMARLKELIGQVEKVDSVAARGLQALADRYDYEQLDQWLEKGETENG